jgi:hypothetical protein
MLLFWTCEPIHISIASTGLGVSDRTLACTRRCPAMNRSSSISAAAPKENIARSYQQLLRLRQLVQQAERSLTPNGINITKITSPGPRINPQPRRQA